MNFQDSKLLGKRERESKLHELCLSTKQKFTFFFFCSFVTRSSNDDFIHCFWNIFLDEEEGFFPFSQIERRACLRGSFQSDGKELLLFTWHFIKAREIRCVTACVLKNENPEPVVCICYVKTNSGDSLGNGHGVT